MSSSPPHYHVPAEDPEEESENDEEELASHLPKALAQAKEAELNFLQETRLFEWRAPKTQNLYHIRAKKWKDHNEGYDDLDLKEFAWPRAFVGNESSPVNAAVWAMPGSKLVAVWTFSPSGDETSFYHLRAYTDDMMDLLIDQEENGAIVPTEDSECGESFSISSGDYPTRNLYCPALESLV